MHLYQEQKCKPSVWKGVLSLSCIPVRVGVMFITPERTGLQIYNVRKQLLSSDD